jgi:hypothetical protein
VAGSHIHLAEEPHRVASWTIKSSPGWLAIRRDVERGVNGLPTTRDDCRGDEGGQ